jgi:VanZ family protein
MRIKINSYWPAIAWMLLSTIAFILPGSTFPKDNWLGDIQFDKIVHVGILSIMVFLWCLPTINRPSPKSAVKILVGIAIGFFSYGVLMEFIQDFFVSNRSFDWGDIGADAVGCLVGFFLSKRQLKLSEQ